MQPNKMENQRILTIEHDIAERKDIVEKYYKFRIFDRDNAIKKIMELRSTNINVATVTSIELLVNSIPFENATDEQIIGELQMQIGVLAGELATLYAGQ